MNTHTQTHSGKMFDIFNPKPEDICIEDIAHALSMQCRFNGHTKEFYSVAEHSLNCARIAAAQELDTDAVLFTLLHDAHEAYLGDFPAPWGNRINFIVDNKIITMAEMKRKLDQTILVQLYQFPEAWIDDSDIKYADLAMLINEKRLALAVNEIPWSTDSVIIQPAFVFTKLDFYKPAEACFQFLKAYQEITQCLQTGSPVSQSSVLSLAHLRT